MSYVLHLVIPGLVGMNTAATRRHRFVQYREAQAIKAEVVALVGTRRPQKPLGRARVTCTRFSASEPDFENMALASKHHLDALVECRVLLDDSPQYVEREYRWEKAPRKHGRMEILVEEL